MTTDAGWRMRVFGGQLVRKVHIRRIGAGQPEYRETGGVRRPARGGTHQDTRQVAGLLKIH